MISMDQTKDSQAFLANQSGGRSQRRIPWLRLHLTNLCNFNCPGCHVFKLSPNKIPATNMPYAVAEKAILEFISLMKRYLPNQKEFHLSIYGGEPLLNRPVIYQLFKKFGFYYAGIRIHWIVNTNGSLLNNEDLKHFIDCGVDIHMSIDGKKEKHNRTRKDKQGRVTFDRVMQALDIVKKKQYPYIQFDCVANPYEIDSMSDVLEVAEQKGVNRIHFDLYYSPDYPKDFNAEKYAHAYAQAYIEGKKKGISLFASPFSQTAESYINRAGANPISRSFPTLEFYADGSFILGELPLIRPFDFIDHLGDDNIWAKRMNLLLELEKEIDGKCQSCFLKEYCQGGMRRIYRYHTVAKNNEDIICDIARKVINNFITSSFSL